MKNQKTITIDNNNIVKLADQFKSSIDVHFYNLDSEFDDNYSILDEIGGLYYEIYNDFCVCADSDKTPIFIKLCEVYTTYFNYATDDNFEIDQSIFDYQPKF